MLNRTGPNTESWGTPVVTGHQLDLTIHHNSSGLAIQSVVYPAKSAQEAVSSQFLQESAVGSGVKGFTKVQVNNHLNGILDLYCH